MRRTLRRAVCLRGRGLFSGRPCVVRIHPAAAGSGWQWRVAGRWHRLSPAHAAPLPHRARLRADGDELVLPEHLLAALVIADVDDVAIEVPGGEVPILDGSGLPFAQALRHAGCRADSAALDVSVTFEGRTARWTGGWRPTQARTFIDLGAARAQRALFRGAAQTLVKLGFADWPSAVAAATISAAKLAAFIKLPPVRVTPDIGSKFTDSITAIHKTPGQAG